jgi:hypothetical protein
MLAFQIFNIKQMHSDTDKLMHREKEIEPESSLLVLRYLLFFNIWNYDCN